jgi:ribokinase
MQALHQVVTLGDINVDLIAHIPCYPQEGGDGLATRMTVRGGGSAANTAIALARFGVQVGIVGRVGDDPLARYALADLEAAGVDLSPLQRDAEAMSGLMFIAVTPDGERTMFGCRGANPRTDPAQLDEGAIARARLLHVSGYALLERPQREAAYRAMEAAHRAGVAVSLDVGLEAATLMADEVRALLPQIQMIFPNAVEAEQLTGRGEAERAVEALLGYGVQVVGLKLGARGCVVGSVDGIFAVPAFDVQVVDSTGAGDAFDAGLILGYLGGLGLRESALLANALGALTTTVEGAGGAIPGREALLAFLQRRVEEPSWADWREELERVCAFVMQRMPSE